MELRAVGSVAQQREDVLAAEVLLLAPEVGKRIVRTVIEQVALVGAAQCHHLVAHLDHRVVVLGIELCGVEGGTGGKGPGCSLVGQTVLLGSKLREVGQAFAGLTQVTDDLVVVLEHRCGTRDVHVGRFGRIEDDRNTAVGAVVTVIGSDPQHRETAEEVGDTGSLALVGLVQIHRGDHLDDVVRLGVHLIHDLPVVLHVAAVARGHTEVADILGLALRTADRQVVAAALEPHDAAARHTLRVVRRERIEGGNRLVNIALGLPDRRGAVFLDFEEVGTARNERSAQKESSQNEYLFHFHDLGCFLIRN